MTYDEIVKMWMEDAKINPEKLDHEALVTPELQGKYFDLWGRENAALTKLQNELKVLKKWKRDYFLNDIPQEELAAKGIPGNPKVVLKSEVDMWVDVDRDVNAALDKIILCKVKTDFLNNCVSSLNGRQWLIKNAIDFLNWKHGVI